MHGSDSVESANKEIALWFKDEELVAWQPAEKCWVYEDQCTYQNPIQDF